MTGGRQCGSVGTNELLLMRIDPILSGWQTAGRRTATEIQPLNAIFKSESTALVETAAWAPSQDSADVQ
jgi:hypothetical protein